MEAHDQTFSFADCHPFPRNGTTSQNGTFLTDLWPAWSFNNDQVKHPIMYSCYNTGIDNGNEIMNDSQPPEASCCSSERTSNEQLQQLMMIMMMTNSKQQNVENYYYEDEDETTTSNSKEDYSKPVKTRESILSQNNGVDMTSETNTSDDDDDNDDDLPLSLSKNCFSPFSTTLSALKTTTTIPLATRNHKKKPSTINISTVEDVGQDDKSNCDDCCPFVDKPFVAKHCKNSKFDDDGEDKNNNDNNFSHWSTPYHSNDYYFDRKVSHIYRWPQTYHHHSQRSIISPESLKLQENGMTNGISSPSLPQNHFPNQWLKNLSILSESSFLSNSNIDEQSFKISVPSFKTKNLPSNFSGRKFDVNKRYQRISLASSSLSSGARKTTKMNLHLSKEEQRRNACVRERTRMRDMNQAFDMLRQKLPYITHQQQNKRISKIEALRMTIQYIKQLNSILSEFN